MFSFERIRKLSHDRYYASSQTQYLSRKIYYASLQTQYLSCVVQENNSEKSSVLILIILKQCESERDNKLG